MDLPVHRRPLTPVGEGGSQADHRSCSIHTAGSATATGPPLASLKSDENPASFARLHCLCSHLCESLRTSRYARARDCRGQGSILGVHRWKARHANRGNYFPRCGLPFLPGSKTSVLLAQHFSICPPEQPRVRRSSGQKALSGCDIDHKRVGGHRRAAPVPGSESRKLCGYPVLGATR